MHLGLFLSYDVLLRLPKNYNLYLVTSTFEGKRRVILQLAGYMSLKHTLQILDLELVRMYSLRD